MKTLTPLDPGLSSLGSATYGYLATSRLISQIAFTNNSTRRMLTTRTHDNSLNQLTSRGVPGYIEVLGVALGTNTVTVNSNSTYRKSEYFRAELQVNNSSSALWTNISVQATNETTVSGNRFVARTAEMFGYDQDGNLTNDGRWAFAWDAENRLVKVESLSATPQDSWRRVEWEYDCRGRRIRQKTSNGSTGSYAVIEDLKFLSDGWRYIAELNATNNNLIRSYAWGLDLSGSMDGAGGVGGLLFISSVANGTHCYAYGGNGNVAALVKTSDGSVSARYEYGPFGEVIRASGPTSDENRFQFSTKRSDRVTDFVAYEYRFYNSSAGRWINRDPVADLGGVVMMVEATDLEGIKRVLLASPEARHILLGRRCYLSRLASLHSRFAFGDHGTAAYVASLYGFVGNEPIFGYDPHGDVAQWVASCGVGCLLGGIGGFFGGLSGGWKGALCGGLGGALNGCCSAVICTTMPNFCIKGSCICGAIGSFAEQMCLGGFKYKDPCAWAALIGSGIVGCLGGAGTVADDAKAQLIQFVTGVDIAALTALCGKF